MLQKIKKKRQSVPRHQGSNLVNLVFALVILTVALMGVAAVFPTGAGPVSAGESSTALGLASEKLDELKRLPTSSSDLEEGTYSDNVEPYSRQWTVTADTPTQGMKRIQVVVEWDSPQGTRQVVLTTYVLR